MPAMGAVYRDSDTGAPLHHGALELRHLDFREATQSTLPFEEWLAMEVADGNILSSSE